MVHALLAHGAEEQAAEPAEAAGADDEQLGVCRGVDEGRGDALALHRDRLDLHAVMLGNDLRDEVLDERARLCAHVVEIPCGDGRAGMKRRVDLPGVNGTNAGTAKTRLVHGPAERCFRMVAAVDTDDDRVGVHDSSNPFAATMRARPAVGIGEVADRREVCAEVRMRLRFAPENDPSRRR